MENRTGWTERTVGKFTYKDGQVIGPKGYMEATDGYKVVMARIEKGQDAVFTYGVQHKGGIVDMAGALLVALQTHYAGWKGTRELLVGLGK